VKTDTMPTYVGRVLEKLAGVRPTPDGWGAPCPCPGHNGDGDQHPSLRVTIGYNGHVLLKCRVGCLTDAVVEAAGLDWSDLFAPEGEEWSAPPGCKRPLGNRAIGADTLHRAYEALLGQLPLEEEHRANLHGRGFTDDEIERRGYRTLRHTYRGKAAQAVQGLIGDDVFKVPGFVAGEFGVTLHGTSTGLLVPVRDLRGRIQALKIRRPTDPKYVYLTSGDDGPSPGSPVHVPLGVVAPAPVVRVTEGELKADVCTALDGTPTVGVPGVSQWAPSLPLLKEMGARTVILAYDAPDVHTKPPVFEQAQAFWRALRAANFNVELEDWHDQLQGA
jgi:hypothetical protein